MTLENTLQKRLAEWKPPGGRHDLVATDEKSGWSVTLTADKNDVLGCLVWEMAVRRQGPAAEGGLRGWADRIVDRVTGLLEPLRVVEVDSERNEALLRSDNPVQKSDKLFYYEVLLKSTTQATIRRFQANHDGSKRTQVAFALTHEALAKFAADLTAP